MIDIKTCPICSSTTLYNFLKCKDFTVSREFFTILKCNDCDFAFTSPIPPPNELDKYYISDNYISHTSKANSLIDAIYLQARKFTLQWKIALVEKNHAFKDSVNILDFGCGTGDFLKACEDKGWNAYGVEPSRQARRTALTKCKTIDIFESIDSLNKLYSAITLWHVLEHVNDLKGVLQEISNRLAHNGTLFIAVPNHKSWDASYYKKDWAGYDVPRHLWHFTQKNMQQLLESMGLRLTETIPMKLDAFYISLLSEKYKHEKQTTLHRLTSAVINGLKSNLKARKTGEYSSLIYIAKK